MSANDLLASSSFPIAFSRLAAHLCQHHVLIVAGESCRIVEVEAYYHSATHPDPFVHADPCQRLANRWYFHRQGRSFRGGSFKGLDWTFGDGVAFGGMLIRAIERADGSRIDGPSRFVDFLLRQCRCANVAELAAHTTESTADDALAPFHLAPCQHDQETMLLRTARVGLSIPASADFAQRWPYLFRRYRFLTTPHRTAKGRELVIIALHLGGHDPEAIRARTGSPRRTIAAHLEAFHAGAGMEVSDCAFIRSIDRCRAYGRWCTDFPIS